MVDVWRTEQHRGERPEDSAYRYSELPNDGKGNAVKYTGEGVTWVGGVDGGDVGGDLGGWMAGCVWVRTGRATLAPVCTRAHADEV